MFQDNLLSPLGSSLHKKSKMINTIIQEEDSSFQYSASNHDMSGSGCANGTSRFYKDLYQKQMNARTSEKKDLINDSSNIEETAIKNINKDQDKQFNDESE